MEKQATPKEKVNKTEGEKKFACCHRDSPGRAGVSKLPGDYHLSPFGQDMANYVLGEKPCKSLVLIFQSRGHDQSILPQQRWCCSSEVSPARATFAPMGTAAASLWLSWLVVIILSLPTLPGHMQQAVRQSDQQPPLQWPQHEKPLNVDLPPRPAPRAASFCFVLIDRKRPPLNPLRKYWTQENVPVIVPVVIQSIFLLLLLTMPVSFWRPFCC